MQDVYERMFQASQALEKVPHPEWHVKRRIS
jgi:hypothetical protein